MLNCGPLHRVAGIQLERPFDGLGLLQALLKESHRSVCDRPFVI
jgi:hypothetical protein